VSLRDLGKAGLTSSSVISHHQRTILTYDALDRDSNKLARGLQRLGVRKGDRVAVSLGNNVEFATVCLCGWEGDMDGADVWNRRRMRCSSWERYLCR